MPRPTVPVPPTRGRSLLRNPSMTPEDRHSCDRALKIKYFLGTEEVFTEKCSECSQCQLPGRFLDRVLSQSKDILHRWNEMRNAPPRLIQNDGCASPASPRKLVMDSLILQWKYWLESDERFVYRKESEQTLFVFRGRGPSPIDDVDVENMDLFLSELQQHQAFLFDCEAEVTLVASPETPEIMTLDDVAPLLSASKGV